MRILFATAEATPYFKTGGLGDVAHALPLALCDRGHEVRVIHPLYQGLRERFPALEPLLETTIDWPGKAVEARYLTHQTADGLDSVLVEQPRFFETASPYGEPPRDPAAPGRRFAFFSRAVVHFAQAWQADVIQLNDWPTGLVAAYGLVDGLDAATVFAIHNLAYQGNFSPTLLPHIGIPTDLFRTENGLEFWGTASFMKAGIALSDRLVTVSPNYAREICTPEYGAGLDGLLRFRNRALTGILNGIDRVAWNPARDPALDASYDSRRMAGKDQVREQLCADLGLDPDGPLFTVVTRLVFQKGLDLLIAALPMLLDRGARLAILGDGDGEYEAALRRAAASAPDRVSFSLGFDDPLARRLYAGGDFFLMPSRYEPCGLGQMIAQRYGTPPVVRRTGGLADTVTEGQTGFLFDRADPGELGEAVGRAVAIWRQRGWNALRRRCMALDWSWERSAALYEDVYRLAQGRIPLDDAP